MIVTTLVVFCGVFVLKMYPIWLAIILSILGRSGAYFITVDAQDEECFFEDMKKSMKLLLDFEITDGGFLDIDIRFMDPDQKVFHKVDRKSNGHYEFAADRDGRYTYCFVNKMSTLTPKVVMFNVNIGEQSPADLNGSTGNKTDSEMLEVMIKELQSKLNIVYQEQEYMNVRDRIHRSINENTNSRVMMWSFFEAFILLLMAVGQVYYLKKFFEVRRVV